MISRDESLSTTLADGWNTFWFTPGPTLPLAMLRIGVGALCLLHFASYGLSSDRWFGPDGLIPIQTAKDLLQSSGSPVWQHPSLLWWTDSLPVLLTIHIVAIVASAAFMVGLFTRASGIVTLTILLSYIHRSPFTATHADPLLAFLLLYLLVGPCGQVFSWDRLWSNRLGHDLPYAERPTIAGQISLRLIQVHLAMFYGMMAVVKLHGDSWWDGEGIWQLLAQTISRPSDWTYLRSYPLVINLWTHAQVWLELAFAILIWNRHFRGGLMIATTILWVLFIQITGMATFGLSLIVAGLAFLPLEQWNRLLGMAGFEAFSSPASRRR